MKPRLTIRQRLVRSLSKRYKVVRANGGWEVQCDGRMESWSSAGQAGQLESRKRSIEFTADRLIGQARELRAQGFRVTFPS